MEIKINDQGLYEKSNEVSGLLTRREEENLVALAAKLKLRSDIRRSEDQERRKKQNEIING